MIHRTTSGISVLIVLFISLVGAVFAWGKPNEGLVLTDTFEGGRAWRSSVGGYMVLSLSGSWREMGRQYGRLASAQMREFYGAIAADFEARGLTAEQRKEMRTTFDVYPEQMKELVRGMSETSGLNLEQHVFLEASYYTLPGLVIEQAKSAPSCSGIAVAAPRTADGKLYFARNWDMTQTAMLPYLKYLALVAFNPNDGSLAFANIRPLGQVNVETGINEKGILAEVNNAAASDPGQNPDGTFVVVELFKLLNEGRTFDEVVERLSADKLDSSYLVQVADSARAVSIEKPTFDTHIVEMKDGELYALNNVVQPIPTAWKGKIQEIPEGYRDDRKPALDRIFVSEEWNGHVTLESVQAMMDKTIDQGGPVVEGAFGTVIQVIAIPADLTVLFRSWGYSGWAEVHLADVFVR